MKTNGGWYGVDLDGTLARYEKWQGIDHIGEPVMSMINLIRAHLDAGDEVRIVTARVGEQNDAAVARGHIINWCVKHIGVALLVTDRKDFGMIALYDDRVITVERNTGRILTDMDAYRRASVAP